MHGFRSIFGDLRTALRRLTGHFRSGQPRHPDTAPAPAADHIDCKLRPEWLEPDLPFPVPNWRNVAEWIDGHSETLRHDLWTNVARHWATGIAKSFGQGCNVYETANIFTVQPGPIDRGRRAARHCEDLLKRLRSTLGDMALQHWYGKFAIFTAPDQDTYYRYLSLYHRAGEHIQSGGVYINSGYGHIVLPEPATIQHSRVLVHEFCHALLHHHRLPLWLDEGITQTAEAAVAGRPINPGHDKTITDHRAFWRPTNIALLWQGHGFDTPGETSALCYDLSRLIFGAFLAVDRSLIAQVVTNASRDDAGFAGFQDAYGQDPADLLAELLGPGDWRTGLREEPRREPDTAPPVD